MISKMNKRSESFRERRHEATAQALLAAAESVMARQGYDGVTMRDMAAEAGCAPGTLYIYFKNKQEVFDAIAFRHIHAFVTTTRQAVARVTDPLDKLETILRVTVDYIHGNRSAFRLLRGVTRAKPGTLKGNLPKSGRDLFQAFWAEELDYIRQAQRGGQLRQDLAPDVIQMCWSVAMVGLLDEYSYHADPPDAAAQTRLIWGFIMGGIRRA